MTLPRPRSENNRYCPNEKCALYGKREHNEIVRNGHNYAGHQVFRCMHCGKQFVETLGTPLYGKRLPKREIINICKLLVEKNGVRSIERITGHHRDTISSLLEDMAEHATLMNDFLVRNVGLDEMEADELWCTVKQKKVERGSPEAAEEGDAWTYTLVKRRSYLFLAHSVGKWTQSTCRKMLHKLKQRVRAPTAKKKLVLYSDGNSDYTRILPELFDTNHIRYGQVVKIRKNGRVVDKLKRGVYGKPRHAKIETTNVENFNGILRERIGRLVRKTKCFPKKVRQLDNAVTAFGFYWNFMKPLHFGKTPAMLEGLTDRAWKWEDFFYGKLSFV